jgi:hypothetical protein
MKYTSVSVPDLECLLFVAHTMKEENKRLQAKIDLIMFWVTLPVSILQCFALTLFFLVEHGHRMKYGSRTPKLHMYIQFRELYAQWIKLVKQLRHFSKPKRHDAKSPLSE